MGSGTSKQEPGQPQQNNVIVVQPKSETRNIETQTGSLSELNRQPAEKRRVRRQSPTPTPPPPPRRSPTPSPSLPPTPPPIRRQATPERSSPTPAPIDDDWNDGERFEFYSDEFPTPQLLRKANEQYTQLGRRQPRRDDGVLLPYPAVTAREQLYKPQDFVSVDRAADNTPTDLLYKPIQELVRYLTKSTFTELETIRALYRWVSVQDVVDRSRSPAADSKSRHVAGHLETPADFLHAIADGEQSYGDLLHVLFRFADIQSRIVNGVVKIRYGGTNVNDHVQEHSSQKQHQQQQQHRGVEVGSGSQLTLLAYKTWTAVVIDGSWHLIDVQHEPRTEYIDGTDGSNELVCVQSNDFDNKSHGHTHRNAVDDSFFLMNPEQFVYSHYPTGDVWQLLARRVTMDEFEELANLSPSFFDLRLSVVDSPRRVVYDKDGELTLNIGQPLDAHYRFRCRLMRVTTTNKNKSTDSDTAAASTTHDGQQLHRYVFLENLPGSVRCHVTFPAAGKYVVDVFCQNVDVSAGVHDETTNSTPRRRSSYRLVCSYLAVARGAADGGRVLPDCGSQQEWGPGWRLGVVGRLRPTTSGDSTVVVTDGELEMAFESTRTTSAPAAKYLVQLHSNTQSRNELKRYVIHSVDDVTGRLSIRAKFPQSGLYALSLFARHPSDSSSSSSSSNGFSNVCTYLVDVRRAADDQTPFPKIANGRLGSTDVASSTAAGLGFRAVSHPTPYLDVGSTDELEMTFGSSAACSYLAELSLQRTSTGHGGGGTRTTSTKDCDNMTFVEEFVDGAVVHVRFPERGLYALKIFGKERSAAGTYSQLFTYLIKVDRPSFVQCPFPCKYVHWSDGCELLRPTGLIGVLPANTVVQFVVRVPKASAVGATSQSARWTALRRVTVSERERFDVEGDDVFSGDVDTGGAGMLALSANFDGANESGSRKTLLSFQVYESLKHSTQPAKREERELVNNETARTETATKPLVKHETFDKEDSDDHNRQQQQREDRRHDNDEDATLHRRTPHQLTTEKLMEKKTADEEQRQKEISSRDKHKNEEDKQNRRAVIVYRDNNDTQRTKLRESMLKIERERHIGDDDGSPAAIFLRARRRKRAKSVGDDQQQETVAAAAVEKGRDEDRREEKRRKAVEWKTEAEMKRADDDDEKKKQTKMKTEKDDAKRREVNNSLRLAETKKRSENTEQQNRQQRNKRLRTILQKSMESRDAPGLRSILDEIDRLRCQQAMEDDYGRGRDVLESLTRVERIKEAIVCTNRATMAEIRGYQRPPDSLRKVLVATLLVLGEDEESTESWQSCQRLCSTVAPDNILKRVVNFHLEELHPEIAARALQLLGDCQPQDVRDACLGAAIFYDWTSGVCRERLDMSDVTDDVQPANDVRAQRQLLKRISAVQ